MADTSALSSWRRYIQADLRNSEKPGEDRISSLSDDILFQILERLPLVVVTRTFCLSKRWLRLSTSLPVLSFKERMFPRHSDGLVSLVVDNTIRRYSQNSIRKFSLQLDLGSAAYDSKLTDWLTFAVEHSVKELKLKFYFSIFTLPSHLCTNSCVLKLWLSCSTFVTPASFVWTSLKCLTLVSIRLSDTLIEEVLAGCPVLEELEILRCDNYTRFDFSASTSLKKLVLHDFPTNLPLTICGPPNLRCFKIYGRLLCMKYCFQNMKSVVEAELRCILSLGSGRQIPLRRLRSIISSVCLVEKLTLHHPCLGGLSWPGDDSLPCLSQLKHLAVDTHFEVLDVIGLVCILKHSPNLKSMYLKLNQTFSFKCGRSGEYWDKEKIMENSPENADFKCLSLYLKRVTVDRFGSYQCEDTNLIQFMGFLLKNARVLEELSIISSEPDSLVGKERDESQFRDTTLALLNLPTSSPNVKITIS